MAKKDNIDTNKKEEQERTTLMKGKFLDMLAQDRVAGNITVAANAVGINRTTVYTWRDSDPEFNDKVLSIVEKQYETRADMAEDKLEEAVRKGNVTAIIFTLKNLRASKYNRDVGEMSGTVKHLHTVSPRFAKLLDRIEADGKSKAKDTSQSS